MDNRNNGETSVSGSDKGQRRETRYRNRKRLEEAEAAKKVEIENKRRKTLFKRRNKVINPNDIIVNTVANKIKFESQENSNLVVKQEQRRDHDEATGHSDVNIDLEKKIVKSEIHLPIDEQQIGNTETQPSDIQVDENMYAEFETAANIDADNFLHGSDIQNKEEDHATELERLKQEVESKNITIKQMRENHHNSTAILIKKNQNLQKLLQEQRIKSESFQKELAFKNGQLSLFQEGRGISMGDLQENKEVDHTNWKELFQEMALNVDELKLELNSKTMEIIKLKDSHEITVGTLERRLKNAYKSCSPFKVMCLFEQVLKVYISPSDTKNKFSQVKWEDHMEFLKSCRLVCKSWKDAVDNVMQQEKSYQNLWSQLLVDLQEKQTIWAPLPLVFQDQYDDINQMEWLNYFATRLESRSITSSYNPVPSRHLMVEVMCRCITNLFSQEVTTYLKNFGDHVWNLTVIIKNPETVRISRVLYRLMEHLPNLKCLTVDTGTAFGKYVGVTGWGNSPQLEMPYLPNLQTLQCRGSMPILPCMIPMNTRNIKRLHLDQKELSFYGMIVNGNFRNLSELSLCCYNEESMNLLRSVSWKFETVILHFPTAIKISLKYIFEFLETFKLTLKTVVLDSPLVEFTSVGQTNLNLPHVEAFNFIYSDWKNINISSVLQNIKRIQTLHLSVMQDSKNNDNSFEKYISSLSKNVIMKSLPELKNISIKTMTRALQS